MKLTKLSYQAQIFWALFIVLIIPSIVLGVTSANKTASDVNQQYEKTLNSITEQVNLNLNTLLADAEKILNLHLINDDIRKVLGKDYTDNIYQYAKDTVMMQTQISQANRLNPNVIISLIKNAHGFIFQYGATNQKDADEASENLTRFSELARKDPHYLYVGSLYHRKYSGTIYQNILPMVKILHDQYDNREIGAFYLGINFNAVANIIESSELPNSKLAFLNRDNELFFSSDEDFVTDEKNVSLIKRFGEIANEVTDESPNKSYQLSYDNKVYDINIVFNDATGWKVVHFMNNSIVTNAYKANIQNFSIIFACNIFFGLLLAYFVSRGLTRSISNLCTAIDTCEGSESLTIHPEHIASNRELEKLINSYNRLTIRLTQSMKENYLTSLNEKQIKLKMLQMQINPHFLYNTLNLISSLGNIHDIPEIKTISDSMSDMLRYNLKSGPIVQIKDEISQIEKYIAIQQLRFPDKFIFECAVPQELDLMPLPAFILQPIIENAVSHGLENRDSDGYLCINVYQEEEDIHILIADNGVGMDKETLDSINNSLLNDKLFEITTSISSSIGIINVHQRIQSYYGKSYGLSIESTTDKGTIIDIVLPLNTPPQIPQEI